MGFVAAVYFFMVLKVASQRKNTLAVGGRADVGVCSAMNTEVASHIPHQGKSPAAAFFRAEERQALVMGFLVLVQAVEVEKAFAATLGRAAVDLVAEVVHAVLVHQGFEDKTLLATAFRAQPGLAVAVQPVMALHGVGLLETPGAALHGTGPGSDPGMGEVVACAVGGLGKALATTFKKAQPGLFSGVDTHVDFQVGWRLRPETAVSDRAQIAVFATSRFRSRSGVGSGPSCRGLSVRGGQRDWGQ